VSVTYDKSHGLPEMIDLDLYTLSAPERECLDKLLEQSGRELSLEGLWRLIDGVWHEQLCDNLHPDERRLADFYQHPVWLLNGIFIEQHELSIRHRQRIAQAVSPLRPKNVVDIGGGFGTLARFIAEELPDADIDICEPYPPLCGKDNCKDYPNIHFVSSLLNCHYDVLVCTDVLEHVQDPLLLLAQMVEAVKPGGHLFIANCFEPVIACHLPGTFHFRYSFNQFCNALGLCHKGHCSDGYASIYERTEIVQPNWASLRQMERTSIALFFWRDSTIKMLRRSKRFLKDRLFKFAKG
jgi:ubiquinone/menaquinone biosynthesis C-methylase UbiE